MWSELAATALVGCSVLLTMLAAATVWWTVHAWREPAVLAQTGFTGPPRAPVHSFSLIVPARHEAGVLGATLDQLARTAHPDFEVIVVVGHDDPDTHAVALEAAGRHPQLIRVVVDPSRPKNKPRALQAALPHCCGDLVGVFDAEDDVDPRLLRVIDATFQRTGADVVQGGVQLINFRSSWYAMRNCLEYFFWFHSRLHLHALHGFIPLGGNTVFVRAELLRAAGGWDPNCLAEDCELGVRLSAHGARVVVAYDPHLVTREETPHSVGALVRQRTRWNQGFLQVYRKGVWRELPGRGQRLLARWTLAQPLLQAFTGCAVGLAVAGVLLLRVPAGIALLSFLPLVPTVAALLFELAGLHEFCRIYFVRARPRDYLVLVLGAVPYQLLLAAASLRAVYREVTGRRGWEKTSHAGSHLPGAPTTAPQQASPAGVEVPA